MSDIDIYPPLIFTPQQRKETRKNLVLLNLSYNLEIINESHQAFISAYHKNNIYGLSNISALFYFNCLDFLYSSHYLFKNDLIGISDSHADAIIHHTIGLLFHFESLKKAKGAWLEKNTLLKNVSFSLTIEEGDKKLNSLEDKTQSFLHILSAAIKTDHSSLKQSQPKKYSP